ncbi:MAG: DUF4012 domain-containing protein [Patescibacteria group bacterium]|nr:DUF4012 domain-containing protein [Patescibacteria group bacterium]
MQILQAPRSAERVMPRKTIKNIIPVLADIRHGGLKYRTPPAKPKPEKIAKLKPSGKISLESRNADQRARTAKMRSLTGIALAFVFLLAISWVGIRISLESSLSRGYLVSRNSLLQVLQSSGSSAPQLIALKPDGGFNFPFMEQLQSSLNDLNGLSGSIIGLSDGLDSLSLNWVGDFFGGNGQALLGILSGLKSSAASISSLNSQLSANSGVFSGSPSTGLEAEMLQFQNAVAGLYDLLDATSSHVLLVIGDPASALRPAGGKITAYADLTVSNGAVANISVRSIAVPDSLLSAKVAPPPELDGVVGKWNAGEANWFFDFPTSAEKIIHFLELSKVYSGSGERFSGLIFINTQSLAQIITAVDPSLLPQQIGNVASPIYLQRVLPVLFQDVSSSASAVSQDFSGAIAGGLSSKNIMVYFPDNRLEGLMNALGYDGGVYNLPYNFNGDYLGVVNINPSPSERDLSLEEHVILKSQIDQSGLISNDLTVENIYSSSSTYRGFRDNLVQIFTPPSSVLISADGMSKPVFENLSQYRAGYSFDPDLSAIENTFAQSSVPDVQEEMQFGLKTYLAWLNGDVGQENKIEVSYLDGKTVIAPGEKFYFVFDRQSGIRQTLDYLVQAPLGYGWKEAPGGGSVYSFHSSELDPRTSITLTLVKEQ